MPKGGVRPGAGRPPGIPNPGTGRPATSKRLKLGDQFYVTRQTPDGTLAGELWTVKQVGRSKLIFECQDETIILTN